jgi:hypothetical protein
MDSETGRFITEDSVDDPNSPNLYVYGANNPLNGVDPTGHFWEELGNFLSGYGWQSGLTADDKANINEQRRVDYINNNYSQADANRIFDYEANNPGFKFTPNMAIPVGLNFMPIKLSAESQLQVYLFGEDLKRQYSQDGNLTKQEMAEITQATRAYATVLANLAWENTSNITKNGFYSETEISGEIDRINNRQAQAFALLAVGSSPEFSAFIGALETNSMMRAAIGEANQAVSLLGRLNELKASIPAGSSGRITMSAAIVEDSAGNRFTLIGTSEPGGYLRPGVTLKPGEIMVSGIKHAEQDLVQYANTNGLRIVQIGATRPVCQTCANAINPTNATIITPLKK